MIKMLSRFKKTLKRHFQGYNQGYTNPFLNSDSPAYQSKNRADRRTENKKIKSWKRGA
jgi:hypothetical protein